MSLGKIGVKLTYPSSELVRAYTRRQIRQEIVAASERHNLGLSDAEIDEAMERWRTSYGFKDDIEENPEFGPVCP